MNRDGMFTISDVLGWIKHIFWYPGDQVVVFVLSFKRFSNFFELTPTWCRGWFSLFVSLLVWWIAYRVLNFVYGEPGARN
jgi:hypothetical protein